MKDALKPKKVGRPRAKGRRISLPVQVFVVFTDHGDNERSEPLAARLTRAAAAEWILDAEERVRINAKIVQMELRP